MSNFDLENVDCHATLAMTKNAQSGRSMIEMLGVLAIIGVLSVGGIAGYSKAMMKYRINKTIEQITLIVGNFRTFYSRQKEIDFGCAFCNSSYNEDKIIQKAKLIPDEMMVLTDGVLTDATNAFGGKMGIERYDDSSPTLYLSFNNIPQEACIEIVSHNWDTSNVYQINNSKTPLSIDEAISICEIEDISYFYMDFVFKVK